MKNAKANRRLLTRRIVIENERFHTWPIDTPSGSSITNPLVIKRNPNCGVNRDIGLETGTKSERGERNNIHGLFHAFVPV